MKDYKTLAELKAALDSGEIKREEGRLIIDNDCTPYYLDGGVCIFEGGAPEDLLEQALNLLGIPWDSA